MKRSKEKIAEALRHAHHALLRDLRRLQDVARPGSDVTLIELRTLLSETYTHLCEHFRWEEQDGYLDELDEAEPRFQRVVQELGEEHRELRRTLDDLHGDTILASTVDPALLANIRNWIDRLRRHEARENSLVEDAVTSDLASAD
ncbi:MAG: hemerythrin domain-containing protein [Planctomycetes bacterium]|nr:hemerythrin domain-containing protein [Planctomycetota bacterium]